MTTHPLWTAAACALVLAHASAEMAHAQTVLGIIDGPTSGDYIMPVIPIEDLNGDGRREFVVSAMGGRLFGPGSSTASFGADLHWFDGQTLQPTGMNVAGSFLSGFGTAAVPAGDFDGDGVTDILWNHYPGCSCNGYLGFADIHSGATAAPLAHFPDPGFGGWGEVLAPLGDVDQDGYDDVLIGCHGSVTSHVYGGPDAHLIRTHYAGAILNSAASLGDLDFDGVPDYAIGGSSAGTVSLFSGATGLLLRIDTRSFLQGFGRSVTGIGDVDGDGVPDYAAGLPGSVWGVQPECGVHVVSGATGDDLAFLPYTYDDYQDFGGGLDGAHDLNGDGIRDLVVTGIVPGEFVHVYSMRTFALLWRVSGSQFPPGGGIDATEFETTQILGDLDGDGLSEWSVSDGRADFNGLNAGRIWIFRGAFTDADSYCPASDHSLGRPARLRFDGPLTIGHPEQRLVVEDAVPSSFAQLFYGVAQAGVPFGDGLLCAGGSLYRLGSPFPLDANGRGSKSIDWSAGPHVTGSGAWYPGGAVGLQVVYRDAGATGAAGFNTTNAIRAVFND